ncbi:MAG: oxidoreductase [Candidatus Marinimicrobia bacterium]|nr:oxidoreductase [Candidatus Neomarinimicrobiota bacterium]
MSERSKSALLLGATGLVGGHCLKQLLDNTAYGRVTVLARRPTVIENDRLDWQVIDFERLEEQAERFQVDALFSCLGTTRKKAGSAEMFRKIDFEYALTGVRLAQTMGTQALMLVTSAGANSRSPFLYMRTKGELEDAIEDLAIGRKHIFRPNLLLGERAENRRAERIGIALMRILTPALGGPLKRYRPIEAETVARAMVAASLTTGNGTTVHASMDMAAFAT